MPSSSQLTCFERPTIDHLSPDPRVPQIPSYWVSLLRRFWSPAKMMSFTTTVSSNKLSFTSLADFWWCFKEGNTRIVLARVNMTDWEEPYTRSPWEWRPRSFFLELVMWVEGVLHDTQNVMKPSPAEEKKKTSFWEDLPSSCQPFLSLCARREQYFQIIWGSMSRAEETGK